MAKDFKGSASGGSSTVKTLLFWGIPLLVLIVLVVLLIMEITGSNSSFNNNLGDNSYTENTTTSKNQNTTSENTTGNQENNQNTTSENTTGNQENNQNTTSENTTGNQENNQNTTSENTTGNQENNQNTTSKNTTGNQENNQNTTSKNTTGNQNTTSENTNKTTQNQGNESGNEEENKEFNDSYIVEKGDNLWSIAKKAKNIRNPWRWKTILIQNKDKIDYTIVSADTGKWKVIIDAGRRLKIKSIDDKKKNISGQYERKKFALQLMSLQLNKLDQAVDIVKFLIRDGYYAYLYRTKTKIKTKRSKKGHYFYRIRTGFFATANEARSVGEEIYKRYKKKRIFPANFWPVLPSYSEISGELIDFGIQRSRPWVIQISNTSNRKTAIANLREITPFANFSYISQKKNRKAKGYSYRTRIGFFEKSAQAKLMLRKIQKTTKKFSNARIVEVLNIMESAPGQKTGTAFPKKLAN